MNHFIYRLQNNSVQKKIIWGVFVLLSFVLIFLRIICKPYPWVLSSAFLQWSNTRVWFCPVCGCSLLTTSLHWLLYWTVWPLVGPQHTHARTHTAALGVSLSRSVSLSLFLTHSLPDKIMTRGHCIFFFLHGRWVLLCLVSSNWTPNLDYRCKLFCYALPHITNYLSLADWLGGSIVTNW